MLVGAERLDEGGWERIHTALNSGDPDDQVRDAWVAKEKVRAVYATDDHDIAGTALDDAIAWCTAPEAGPELARLAKSPEACPMRPAIAILPAVHDHDRLRSHIERVTASFADRLR